MNEEVTESDFLFYKDNNKQIQVRLIMGDETVWATQRGMSEIFGTTTQNISAHLGNIFKEVELDENSVCKEILHTASDGKKYNTKVYNLDCIISVGYRVSSYKATQFRIWATSVIKEYMVKGFVVDDDRLKQGSALFGKDYFGELLERIREIRASERRFYQKITDLYAQASIDYDAQSEITHEFYATVQNKLHFAVTHHTAAELIQLRADSSKPNMGLTTWKNAPEGKILKPDVVIGKNYLSQEEISELNIVVNMYLDYAELQAKKQNAMRMADWIKKLDEFLKFNEYDLLKDSGKISKKLAHDKAEKEFIKFRVVQDKEYKSDFDKVIEEVKSTGKLPQERTFKTPRLAELLNIAKEEDKGEFNRKLSALLKVPKPDK